MKAFPSLKKVEIGAITAAAILIAGCGQAPTDDAPANAGQVEALRKEAASLKSKLASAQAAIDSEAISHSWDLFSELYAHSGDANRAWALTLTALFQDMRVAHH